MACTSTEFYEWLIRVTNLIRDQQDPHDRELFVIFARELAKVLPFDVVGKYDATSSAYRCYAGPGFEKLSEELEEIYREKVEPKTAESEILAVWVHEHQETVILGSLDHETRFATTPSMRQAGLHSVCAIPLSDPHHRLGSLVIASVRRDAYSPDDVRFGTLAANQVALAMDDAINFRAAQRARDRLTLLLDLTNRVVSKLVARRASRDLRQHPPRIGMRRGRNQLCPPVKIGSCISMPSLSLRRRA